MARTRDRCVDMPGTMCRVRLSQGMVHGLLARGLLYGSALRSMGQSASSARSILSVADLDYILSSYRGHGHSVFQAVDLNQKAPELLGKATFLRRPFTPPVPAVSHSVAVS